MSSWLLSLIVAAVLVQIAVFCTTVYVHRCATHLALTMHPAAAWVFRLMTWLTTGIVIREWVAVHRKHHTFAEKEGDPHSPHIEGFWRIQLLNVLYYVRATRDPKIVEEYAPDVTSDRWDKYLFDHGWTGLAIGVLALCFFFGVRGFLADGIYGGLFGIGWGLLAAAVHAFLYVFVLSPSINGLCHWWGYKNFENTATNIKIVALLTGGEGLHNNHHASLSSPKLSYRRSEVDPGWLLIRGLALVRLARPGRILWHAPLVRRS